MDDAEKTVASNVKPLRPNTQIVGDRSKELVTYFIQKLGEAEASGISVDSVQFAFIGTKNDKTALDHCSMHYWVDESRSPAKELAYLALMLQYEANKEFMPSQDDKD